MKEKTITIGIPCYKASKTIDRLLASILMQTFAKDRLQVILANDCPEDNHAYDYLHDRFPELNIVVLGCKEHSGPGIARQRCLDACTTDYIIFCDADDTLHDPFVLENLISQFKQDTVVEVFAPFMQVTDKTHPQTGVRINVPQRNPLHPWVFGRLYSVKFLKDNNIRFPDKLRAMEDACFNWQINMLTNGTQFKITCINDIIAYDWMPGSEHSITRIGTVNNIPQYNFDLCRVGAILAAEYAINFVKAKNPFNANIMKFATEQFVNCYFMSIECEGKRKEFLEQCLYLSKYFYNKVFKCYETLIPDKALDQMYTQMMVQRAGDLVGVIPFITFHDWLTQVRESAFDVNEIVSIRQNLPKEVIDNDVASGVMDASCNLFIGE